MNAPARTELVTANPTERWRIVYVGFRFFPQHQERFHVYRRIVFHTADDLRVPQLGRELLFKRELLKAEPGAIFECDAIPTLTDGKPDSYAIKTKTLSYTHDNWRDVDDAAANEVNVWYALDRAQAVHSRAASKSRIDGFEANLKPLRTAYLNMTGPERAILIAQVVTYIGGGR